MSKALVIGGLVALGVLGIAAVAMAGEKEATPGGPTPPPPPPKPGPAPGTPPTVMTIDEKAFAVRNHSLYWTWQSADKACRAMNADEDPEGTVATCGAAMALWKDMMSDVGVKLSEEEAVYNKLAGG